MASSRVSILGRSIEKGSEELFEYFCTFCDYRDVMKEAKHYCAHCDGFFCESCLQDKHADRRGHQVVNISNWGQVDLDKCPCCLRDGAEVSKHCEDDDLNCCSQCAKADHAKCPNVCDIATFARGVYSSTDFNSLKIEVEEKTKEIVKMKDKKKDIYKPLQRSRKSSLKKLKSFRKTVDKIFNKLGKEAKEEIKKVYSQYDYILDTDIETCEDMLANLRLLKTFMESKTANEPQMFMKLKQIREMLTKYDSTLITQESRCLTLRNLKVIADQKLLSFKKKIGSLKLNPEPKEEQDMDHTSIQPGNPDVPVSTPSPQDMNYIAGATADVAVQSRMSATQIAPETIYNRAKTHEIQASQAAQNTLLDSQKTHQRCCQLESNSPQQAQGSAQKNAQKAKNEIPVDQPCLQDQTHEIQPSQKINNSLLHSQNAKQQPCEPEENRGKKSQKIKRSELHEEEAFSLSSNVPSTFAGTSGNVPQVEKMQGVRSKSVAVPKCSRSHSYHSSNITYVCDQSGYRTCREEEEEPKVEHINIRLPNDKHQCNIQGMIGLKNQNIILSDTKNKKLKVIDQSYQVIASCELSAGPRGVCVIDDYHAVTALSNKTLQFVTFFNARTMKPSKSIQLSHGCYGLTHYNGTLYVTEQNGRCVYVYDTDGNYLNTISEIGLDRSPRFVSTQHVYITRDGARIYIADEMKGLVAVNATGATLSAASQTGLLSACGVCTDTAGNVYVSGWRSHTVVKYGDRGTKACGVILSSDNGVTYPTSIWFNSFKSHMIVSNNPEPFGSDVLNVCRI